MEPWQNSPAPASQRPKATGPTPYPLAKVNNGGTTNDMANDYGIAVQFDRRQGFARGHGAIAAPRSVSPKRLASRSGTW